MRRIRKRVAVLLALVALAALGGAVAQESFVHTDDGCAVEVHCLACRWAYATTAVVSPCLTLAPVLAMSSTAAPADVPLPAAPRLSVHSPRGPPLAS